MRVPSLPLKAKFILFFSSTYLLFLVLFCVFVYRFAVHRSYSFAEQTLAVLLEHEREHLDLANHAGNPSEEAQHISGIHLRIRKNGEIAYDSFPRSPSAGESLTRLITEKHNGDTYILEGLFDMSGANAYLELLRNILTLGCLGAGVMLIPLSALATRLLLKPFRRLAHETSEISVEKLSFRFPDPHTEDEYGILARNFNELLGRLDYSFHQVKRFALNASHELRTPLAVIISQGEMALRRERSAEEYRTALTKIVAPAKRLRESVNGLLFLAELDRLKKEIRISKIPVETTVKSVIEVIHEAYGEKGIQFSFTGEGPKNFQGNKEIFQVVVANLIENAYKFSHTKIEISFVYTEESFTLCVEDDGPGIPLDQQHHLVRNAVTPDVSTADTSPNRGSGLGLSIVKACLEAVKGSLELGNSKLGGAQVSAHFPL